MSPVSFSNPVLMFSSKVGAYPNEASFRWVGSWHSKLVYSVITDTYTQTNYFSGKNADVGTPTFTPLDKVLALRPNIKLAWQRLLGTDTLAF